MKFNRAALIAATQKALAAHRADWDAEQVKILENVRREKAAWFEAHAQDWADLATTIRRKLKAKQPITENDMPRRRYNYVAWWVDRPSHVPLHPRDYRAPHELAALLVVLEAVTDDYVTSSGLAALGITSRGMANAVAHLAKATTHA